MDSISEKNGMEWYGLVWYGIVHGGPGRVLALCAGGCGFNYQS